ncbi:Alcohol dehydrogenase GroES domain protein [Pseudomonas savastanoi]|uniref:Alcohol dehydrogenase GroES domain protein n=1 Tax=Pseudomonas savastanoi TaxID=29438 RepID=A0A3M5GBC2_PSESS|nr:Alcohol dehydrogenase GroES domain protein [Pseudomonas savastanoi]
MKALTFESYGKSPEIAITHVPLPTIKPDELLVEVHAAGLNPIDNMITTGTFKAVLKYELPAIMGSDLSGVVIAVGKAVTRFKAGDAIFASLFDLGKVASPNLQPCLSTLLHLNRRIWISYKRPLFQWSGLHPGKP